MEKEGQTNITDDSLKSIIREMMKVLFWRYSSNKLQVKLM